VSHRETHVHDDAFDRVRQQFNDTEIVNLTMAVAAINAWNRIAISMRTPPGAPNQPRKAVAES